MRELTARGRKRKGGNSREGAGRRKRGGRGDLKTHLNPPNFQTL